MKYQCKIIETVKIVWKYFKQIIFNIYIRYSFTYTHIHIIGEREHLSSESLTNKFIPSYR